MRRSLFPLHLAGALLVTACEPASPPAATESAEQAREEAPSAPVQPSSPATEPEAPSSSASAAAPAPARPHSTGACDRQGDQALPQLRLKAIGTEPFWGAEIRGRCVTYSAPEQPEGTRVWTRWTGTGDVGRWAGALNGRPFTLTTRAEPNCSDGMSDRRYPLAVELHVGREVRTGCAAGLEG
jgi:uncharacterized membrane protein